MIDLSQFQAVLWDMDGTIVHNIHIWEKTYHSTTKDLGRPLSEKEAQELHINFYNILSLLQKEMPLDVSTFSNHVAKHYLSHMEKEEIETLPGVLEVLQHMQSLGKRQAIVSSANRPIIDSHLRKLDLGSYFDFTISCNDVQNEKPHPEPYLKAAQKMQLSPSQCLVFEDSTGGLKSAKAAGMTVVLCPSQPNVDATDADHVVADLKTFFDTLS